ncbi:L,D-transpeptidase family protein [Longibacter salinarum]|uniref:L,D-transpeptidase family protein n=1 Tax=Longibacter salinarum TaxID=1850348 RepID=UPI001180C934|nr:L,D-transpeptidase family protein [Longibacter salinarum]
MKRLHSKRLISLGTVLVIVTVLLAGCQDDSPPPLKRVLDDEVRTYDGARDSVVRRAYVQHEWQPVWLTKDGPTPEARALLRQLCEAPNEGLPRERYNAQGLIDTLRSAYIDPVDDDKAQSDSLRRATLASADIALTRAFLRYANDLSVGRLNPEDVQGTWHVDQDRAATIDVFEQAMQEGVQQTLDDISARHLDYVPLRQAFNRYRQIAQNGGWPTLPSGVTLAPGDSSETVTLLRRRLAATNDLEATASDSAAVATVYDGAVEQAVNHFQRRHGLEINGVVNDATRAALNVSADERARQLALNLERHRWLPENLGQDFIFVNLMDFRLNAFREGEEAMEMPVIVGEKDKQTTAFADTMSYVVFGPYWNIPKSIAIDEILPKVKDDEEYLAQNDYEVVNAAGDVVDASLLSKEALERYDVRLREKPGPGNSLGLVKFMFPNDHDIYLHDTPADHLFDAKTRTFSHGCVRVESPDQFAEFVLPDDWTEEKVREAMNADERKRVRLEKSLPVYLVYLTAWAEPDGAVHFRSDLYNHDDELRRALDEPEQRPKSCAQLDSFLQKLDEAANENDGLLTRVFR